MSISSCLSGNVCLIAPVWPRLSGQARTLHYLMTIIFIDPFHIIPPSYMHVHDDNSIRYILSTKNEIKTKFTLQSPHIAPK